MRRFSTATRLALTSSTIAIVAGFPGSASAKGAPVETTAAPVTTVSSQDVQSLPTNSNNPADIAKLTPASSGPGITVTGSRIRRPNLESVVPVTSIQGEQFFQRGATSVGDQLNDLPQLRSSFAQQNSGLGIGIAGLNLLDLRGLGPKRTLVLVNGRRHVPADITNNASNPDVGSIPNELIDRVDIVTGGNSAVYGSDAIAGVVNFILKRNFDGIQVRAQGAEAAAGFGTNYIVSAIAGQNFAGGRGNVTLSAEYSHQDRVFGSEVPWLRRLDGLAVIDVDPGGLPNGSDSFPDRTFVRDIRLATTSLYGMVYLSNPSAAPACGVGLAQTNGGGSSTPTPGLPASANGTPYDCNYIFMPNGSFTQQTGARYSTGPLGGFAGGNGQTGREGELLSVLPKTNRWNLNAVGHFQFSDAFDPFFEAKWSHQEVAGNNASPGGIQGTFAQYDIRERVRLDNPFLTPDQRTQISNLILASGCNPSLTAVCMVTGNGGPTAGAGGTPSGSWVRATKGLGTYAPTQGVGGPLNATDISLINSGVYRFGVARIFQDIGIRDEIFTRDTYRIVGGIRGTFNTDWSYELSANYGQFDETDNNRGFVDRQRLMLSLDAGRDPATGTIKCRAQFDPNAAVPLQGPFASPPAGVNELSAAAAAAAAAARLAADIAACVPYNPFGSSDNSAAARYFLANITKHSQLTQFDLLGFVNGDSSQLFELPGGPIGFVIGGEYRRQTGRYIDDPFVTAQATNNVVITDFTPPAFHVTEAFGELNIPILKDQPFFYELSLSGAGRYSHYQKVVGDVWTYNVGGEWAPVRDIRFRANYGKAVRAPNFAETAFPAVANFAPNFVDPCTSGSIGANANRTANCTADLGALLSVLPNVTQSLNVVNGSNPFLKPEVSHSLTIGGVLQPRFIPGLSASVDYWSIKVDKVIVALGAQQIANLCYDAPSLNNQYCALFTRWRGPGLGSLGEQPGQILGNSLSQSGVNFAGRVRRGLDFNANYRARLSNKITLDTGLIWVHVLKNSNYNDPLNPKFEDRILGELGDPQDEGRLDVDLKVGNVTFGYNVHYIGSMIVNFFEDWNALPAACPPGQSTPGVGGCPPNNSDFADIRKYPAVSYHGLRFQWDTGPAFHLKNIQVYAGVDNIFDKHAPFNLPPGGSLTSDRITGSQTAIYDARGRNFYGGIKFRY
jgi:outer membrane receptor protein involved in Fe transport